MYMTTYQCYVFAVNLGFEMYSVCITLPMKTAKYKS